MCVGPEATVCLDAALVARVTSDFFFLVNRKRLLGIEGKSLSSCKCFLLEILNLVDDRRLPFPLIVEA